MRGLMVEYYNWTSHGGNIVQDYYEAPSVSHVSEEPTSAGHVEGVPDDGTRSVPVDAGTSSYIYGGGGPYDYDDSGLADHFSNIVHVADQLLWDNCNQSQLGRYKPARGRDPHRKKSRVLRYLALTPRLQRLYSLRVRVKHMPWHATHQTTEGSMCHPSDADVWKHFDRMCHDFAEEPCNVRMGL
ncbi:hypothetical protein Sango_1594600 [Sesamum angolense]|uniref:Uncharacterized protein n=1 Tax=Sesamum angolense TaxID=2727404 RepID=A0AAE2BU24_9LAMI|nr:hypothetical protein Sango_1594600 [Sesamum angolense]